MSSKTDDDDDREDDDSAKEEKSRFDPSSSSSSFFNLSYVVVSLLKSSQTVANTRRGIIRCVYPLFDYSRKESSLTSSWRKISILEI